MDDKRPTSAQLDTAFECLREADKAPVPSAEAEVIFQRARAMEKAPGPKDFNAITKLYAEAGEKGHWKALHNLQNMYYEGLIEQPKADQQVIDINERLIKMGAPIGYYNMATYLEQGYGVKQDQQAALAYYRKSADLGSPQGQLHVGKVMTWDLKNFDIGVPMLECAMGQGNGRAARELSGYHRVFRSDLKSALAYAQKGAALGNAESVHTLVGSFEEGAKAITDYGAGIDKDRAARYRAIEKEIERNPSARFPDIDKIVPLPPAPLPPWDGTFEYRKPNR